VDFVDDGSQRVHQRCHLSVKGGLCDPVVAVSVPTECSLGRVLMDVVEDAVEAHTR
jgi:hypothetical protein